MNEYDWDDCDVSEKEEANELTVINKKNVTPRNRKWREIEQLKEHKRLEKEMLMYDEYNY